VASIVSQPVHLFSYVAPAIMDEVAYLAADCGAVLVPTTAHHAVSFDYLHPLSTPVIRPAPARIHRHSPIQVSAEVVLRFGMLEGDAIVNAPVAIYDPQSAFGAPLFAANGSSADRLAIVMNRTEAGSMTGLNDPEAAAAALINDGKAQVVIIKLGGQGALVVTPASSEKVPFYRTERVWKLGSGDVFSATFAALWGCRGLDPREAADLASRAAADYCNTRALPAPSLEVLRASRNDPVLAGEGTIYLAGPFFDIAQRWLIEEARALLLSLGARVFSPVHEVGPGPAKVVAPEDIAGLETADVVFAIANGLDPGTVFEIGYAVKLGKPVVVLAQNIKDEDLKMIEGSNCEVVDDFATALYRVIGRLPVR
jgi:nucleoside 2-deoxyribosyltransferase